MEACSENVGDSDSDRVAVASRVAVGELLLDAVHVDVGDPLDRD